MAASGSIWSRNVVAGSVTATSITADDLDVDGTTLTIDADNNRVGIGLSNPTQLFHVEGPMVQDWVARIKNTHSTSGQSYGLQIVAGTNASDLAFAVKNQANSATYLEVQGDGKVGIGTDAPSTTLDVAGNVAITGTTPKLTIGDAGAEDTMIVFDGNAQDYRIGLNDGTDGLEIGVGAAHDTTPALTIDSNTDIEIFGSLSINSDIADTKVSGITAVFTAGEILKQGEVCYFKPGDSRMWKALATAVATSRCVAMATEDLSAGGVGKFLLQGFFRCAANFPPYTVGSTLYTPEVETANDATDDNNAVPEQVAPDTTGDFVQVIGWAITSDMVFFNPSNDIIEVA